MSRFAIFAAFALGLSPCNAQAPSFLEAPANPNVRVRPPGYTSVTAGVKNFEVTGPKDWRELNRQVAPADRTEDRGADSGRAARRGR